MDLHVRRIGQQLFQEDDVAERVAGELLDDVRDSRERGHLVSLEAASHGAREVRT